ncbi:MAG TPA: carbohydrate kinase family protein, partial [Gemmatimonadaceae bacterium]|nr:carbohydrate kinase family protein [Gemmatimonadaceae bacterium]
ARGEEALTPEAVALPASRIPHPGSSASRIPHPASRKKRLGVIGTFVWDTIHGRDPRSAPVQEWGGITYALAGLDAALSDEWEIVPVIKVGADLAARARNYLHELRHIASDAALIEVPYPNNRVELRYETSERRAERLTGGVPGWSWLGLKPLLAGLDALYINFLSGWELDLETSQLIRQHFRGPIYCDLHMLVMAVQPSGWRTLQPLPNVAEWCRCFDILQVNEDELAMMAPDPLALAATALASGVRCLVVTLGSRGAAYFAAPDFACIADLDRPRPLGAPLGPARTARVPAERVGLEGDPTGCGDVWGATYFSRLLAGESLDDAIRTAHRAAARNVEHRGATGLSRHLRGELIPQ